MPEPTPELSKNDWTELRVMAYMESDRQRQLIDPNGSDQKARDADLLYARVRRMELISAGLGAMAQRTWEAYIQTVELKEPAFVPLEEGEAETLREVENLMKGVRSIVKKGRKD